MTFADHFSSLAKQYAEFRPTYPDALFSWLSDIAPHHALAWDCACGNGQASYGLAPFFDKVVATDASKDQLQLARQHSKIEYRLATAEHSGLPANSVDLVSVAQAVHWFDLDAFYKEVRRVTKPGSILVLWTYEFFSMEDKAIENHLRDFYENTLGPYWPAERSCVKNHYTTLPFPFVNEITPPHFQQTLSWSRHHLIGYLSSWSAVKKYKMTNGIDPVQELEKKLIPLWEDPQVSKSIVMPIHMRVARI
ncbi:MAG: class I SAM-dependent methyltransferase [Alphaproteobacteria bacterium]|nr:class I SAM-dependent methyltransferase [Alphaproteobacteria bacterium]